MKNRQGYIALTSLLIVSMVIVILTATMSSLSIQQSQNLQSIRNSIKTRLLAESCVEEALLQININNSLNPTITLPEGSCSVTINSQSGNDWGISIEAVLNTYYHTIEIDLTRSSVIQINDWKEE